MSKSYHNFAFYYTQLIPYEFYEAYATKLNKLGQFKRILDLGCGCGSLCEIMKSLENKVIGLDISEEMLSIATYNNYNKKIGIEYIVQDLKELVLNDKYDLIVSTLDTLNYIDNIDDIKMIINKVYQALDDGGYFYFDMITLFYINHIVNDHYQYEELDTFSYEWIVNKVDDSVIKHSLLIDNKTDIYEEEHLQYGYDINIIKNILVDCGFKTVKIEEEKHDFNMEDASRVYFIAQK